MKKFLSTTLTLGLLGGSLLPAYSIVETPSPKKLSAKVQKLNETKNKFDYINLDWWKSFNDPYLTLYIEHAVNYNHNLKIATLTTKEYYQAVKLQLSNELPALNAAFAPGYVKVPYFSSSSFQFALPLTASYEADIFLKNRDKTRATRKVYEMSLIEEKSAYIAVASAVGSTYFNIINLDKQIDLQKQIVQQRKTIFELMSKRNAEGLTSTADLMKANKAYVSSTTELTELEKKRDSLLHSFCVLIGESSDNIAGIERSKYEDIKFSGVIPNEISSEVITQRPDYQKALYGIAKAGIDVRVAKKEFLPVFNIGGMAIFNGGDIGKMFNTITMLNAIGASGALNVFAGGAKIANLKLKKASYEKAIEQYQQTSLTSVQEINDALLYVKKDSEKLANVKKQEEFEKKDNGYFQQRYAQGIVSKLDLAQSQENLLTINKLAVNSQIACYIDYIGLYKAVGSKL